MNISLIKHATSRAYVYVLLAVLSAPHLLMAEGAVDNPGPTTGARLINPLAADSIVQLIGLVFNIITILLIPVAIFFLVLTGFNFITAGGDKKKLGDAKMQFFYVVIGIALILGAQLIGAILQNTLVDLKR